MTAGHEQATDAAFQGSNAVFDNRLRRVHDSGVDVAQLLQCEEVGCVRRVVERVRRRLIDGQRARVGSSVGRLPRVDLLGFEGPALAHVILLEFRW